MHFYTRFFECTFYKNLSISAGAGTNIFDFGPHFLKISPDLKYILVLALDSCTDSSIPKLSSEKFRSSSSVSSVVFGKLAQQILDLEFLNKNGERVLA